MKELEPGHLCESDDPEIIRIAGEITGKKKSDLDKAKAIYYWVRDEVLYEVIDVVGAKGVLKRKPMRAVCIDKANLLVALCRSVGIPARYLSLDVEFKFKIKDVPRVQKHILAEINLGGEWIMADPSFDRDLSILIKPAEFGKVNWTVKSQSMTWTSIPFWLPLLVNLFFYKFMPESRKFARIIQGLRS